MGVTPDPDLEAMWLATFQKSDKNILVEMFAKLLGIDHVLDTVVGDELLKGISGGQKRRVTSGGCHAVGCDVLCRAAFGGTQRPAGMHAGCDNRSACHLIIPVLLPASQAS